MTESSRTLCFFWGIESSQELLLRSCGNFTLVPPDREVIRTVDFGEFFWPVSGRGCFNYEGRSEIVKPGWAWYYPPGSCHDYYPLDTFHYCWLAVYGKDAGTFFRILNLEPGLNRAGVCPVHLFNHLGSDFNSHTQEHRIMALSTAFRIVSLCSLQRRRSGMLKNQVEELKNQIELNFGDPELNVGTLAADIGMHRGSFSRAFHQAFGETVSNYITSCRVKHAMALLKETQYSIRDIAAECGFRNANYFAKVFMARFGVSPSDFRKKYSLFSSSAKPEEP